MQRKEPLYRKENKRSLCTIHNKDIGSEYRYSRNTKRHRSNFEPMTSKNHGRDYTPLFRFLLSKIGKDWADVYSEAKSRLDTTDPIFWMVKRNFNDPNKEQNYVRVDEKSYWSKLFVDENNILQIIDPKFPMLPASLSKSCTCCTYSFNGKVF